MLNLLLFIKELNSALLLEVLVLIDLPYGRIAGDWWHGLSFTVLAPGWLVLRTWRHNFGPLYSLLELEYPVLVLIEAHEVEVEVFYPILVKDV